jgi:ParB/RepB/Spo0J family partition protein
VEVPLAQVVPDPKQPRQDWEHDKGRRRLQELAASIKEFGVLQPLLVREEEPLSAESPCYIIISGARRRAAAELAELTTIPVVIRGAREADIRILQLIENLQRQNLSPIDEARAYQELMDYESLSPRGVAERLHVSDQHVRDRLRVLADQVLADAVERRQISATAAREIMKLPDDEVLEFRNRIKAGERLQTNDVAGARARLLSAGIVNPRRTPGGGRGGQTSFDPQRSSAGAAPVATGAPSSGPDADVAELATVPEPPALDGRPAAGAGRLTAAGPKGGQTSFDPPAMFPALSAPSDDTAPSEKAGGGPAGQPATVGADQREAALWLAEALDAGLQGSSRKAVTSALRSLGASAVAEECWRLVYHHLYRRLAASDHADQETS